MNVNFRVLQYLYLMVDEGYCVGPGLNFEHNRSPKALSIMLA